MSALRKYLNILFDPEEWINAPTESFKETLASPLGEIGEPTWVCANPLEAWSSRRKSNISGYRNFVVEFDNMDENEQLAYIRQIQLPYSTIVHSGNKSFHAVISLAKPVSAAEYKVLADALREAVPRCDKACLEASRLTRCPSPSQFLARCRDRVQLADVLRWLGTRGIYLRSPIPEKQKPRAWSQGNRLTLKTMKYLSGQLPREEMHEASLHAARNLLEVGTDHTEVVNTLAGVRQRTVVGESEGESKAKANRVLEWVLENWDVK